MPRQRQDLPLLPGESVIVHVKSDGGIRPPDGGGADTGLRVAAGSVWPVAQRSLAVQRRGRYTPMSGTHPGRMALDLAAYAIATYTVPGDLVVDPMCGIGTRLVEAVHAGRHAPGFQCEERWVQITRDNLPLASSTEQPGTPGSSRPIPGTSASDLPWPMRPEPV